MAPSERFNSVEAERYALRLLAVNPPVVLPPVLMDPVIPSPLPDKPQPSPSEGFRTTQFELMNWTLGCREEALESPDGVWVVRSLGINGRWDNLSQILSEQRGEPKAFDEL
jgi:hypothetical protein